jgi:hypothetical protein
MHRFDAEARLNSPFSKINKYGLHRASRRFDKGIQEAADAFAWKKCNSFPIKMRQAPTLADGIEHMHISMVG